jgi:peroxiredoxin Q/BCP
MLNIGQSVPHFALPDQDGLPRSIDDLLATGWLLLYFYPADFTPLCTAQACMARDHHTELAAAGVTVVGVSRQDTASKHRFAQKHRLPFTLLADTDSSVHRVFGVLALGGLIARRVTFLITRDQVGQAIVADRYESNFTLGGHTRFVERVMARVRSAPTKPPTISQVGS